MKEEFPIKNEPEQKPESSFFRVRRILSPAVSSDSKKEEIHQRLDTIYREGSAIPDMTRLEKKKRNPFIAFLLIFVFLLFSLLVASWVSFYFFSDKNFGFKGDQVSVEISGEEEAASGSNVQYEIVYKNQEEVPLRQAELRLTFPKNFSLTEASIPSKENGLWEIGTLARGDSGTLRVSGRILGTVPSEESLSAVFTYWPEGFNSEFQKTALKTIKITSSVISLAIQGGEEGGEKRDISIVLENRSDKKISNVRITALYPQEFQFTKAVPAPSRQNSVWSFYEIAPKQKETIMISGEYQKNNSENKESPLPEITVRLEFGNEDGVFFLQQEEHPALKLLSDRLRLNLILNGSTGDQEVDFSSELNYTLVYSNVGDSAIENLELRMPISDFFDEFSYQSESGGEIKDGEVVFYPSEKNTLKKIAPKSEGVINFRLRVVSNPEESSSMNFRDTSRVEARFLGSNASIASNSILLKIRSGVNFSSSGRYYVLDGKKLGTGPLPPKIGEKTAYQILWKFDSGLHDLENIRMSALLPENVSWEKNVSYRTGKIEYRENGREIIWTISRVPAKTSNLEAEFFVSVIPKLEDAGKILVLLPSTKFEALDLITKSVVTSESAIVTTTLEGDSFAAGKGVVK